MNETSVYRLHATIEGHVQGVGFRSFVLDKASLLGLSGWVRNTMEGDVECIAEGDRESLDLLIDYMRRGPRGAFVTRVDVQWDRGTGEFPDFRIGYTI